MIEIIVVALQGIAVAALSVALIYFPRKTEPLFRIERVSFHDGTVVFYPMKRTMFGWKNFQIEKGVRGYRTLEEATSELEQYFVNNLGCEISESIVVKEYM
jgi:hypothetical protein